MTMKQHTNMCPSKRTGPVVQHLVQVGRMKFVKHLFVWLAQF